MANSDQIVLWVIDRDYISEPDEVGRVGYGQTGALAQATIDSHNQIIGRSHYVSTGLKSTAIPAEYSVRFKLLDDDGEVYYGGACDVRILTGELSGDDGEDFGYNIDLFGMDDAGAVHGLYKAADLIRCGATTNRPGHEGEAIGVESRYGGTEWRAIYG